MALAVTYCPMTQSTWIIETDKVRYTAGAGSFQVNHEVDLIPPKDAFPQMPSSQSVVPALRHQ